MHIAVEGAGGVDQAMGDGDLWTKIGGTSGRIGLRSGGRGRGHDGLSLGTVRKWLIDRLSRRGAGEGHGRQTNHPHLHVEVLRTPKAAGT
jgi:hypothetical protein